MTYEEFQKPLWESKSKTGITSLERVIDRLSVIVYELNEKVEFLEKENKELKQFVRRNIEPDLRYMG